MAAITSSVALCSAMLFGVAAAPAAEAMQTRRVQGPTAILTVISGGVLLRSADGSYSSAMDGAVLYIGTMLRTSFDSRALITLSDGSIVELDPASDVTIEDAMPRVGSTIAQSLGRTLHVVMHLTTADSRYDLTTPAVTASVRGGEYEVVTADGLGTLTTAPSAPEIVATTVAVTTNMTPVVLAQTTTLRVRKPNAKELTLAAPAARFRERAVQSDRDKD